MKAILRRRKSQVHEQPLQTADRPREEVPQLPQPSSRVKEHVLRAPTPMRFSGAGWDEFLTNISAPQGPITPLSQSPSTSNTRLPTTVDAQSPMDAAFKSSLSASPGLNGTANGVSPGQSPTGFSNAHMLPPSSPALTNGLGSPISSPVQPNGHATFPGESRFPLGIVSNSPSSQGGPFVASTNEPAIQSPPSSRGPMTPATSASPLRAPNVAQTPDSLDGSGALPNASRAANGTNGYNGRARGAKDADQSDAVSIKSNVSSSSKKARLSRFFKRNKSNSDDWPEDNMPAMPKLPAHDFGSPSTPPTKGPSGPLSPPDSSSSHPPVETGSASFGAAFQRMSRKMASAGGLAQPAATEQERMWDEFIMRSSRESAPAVRINAQGEVLGNGPGTSAWKDAQPRGESGVAPNASTATARGQNGFAARTYDSPPPTDGSAKASTDQSNQSRPSTSSVSATAPTQRPAERPKVKIPTRNGSSGDTPTSPSHLLPTAPMLRTQTSQSSLQKLLEDMNLPLDEPTPAVTVLNTENGETSHIVEATVKQNRSPLASAPPQLTVNVNGDRANGNASKPAEDARRDSNDDDGTDSIAALHKLLGNFDLVTPLSFQDGPGLPLTLGAGEVKTGASPARVTAIDTSTSTTPGLTTSPTLLNVTSPLGQRRGSAISGTSNPHSEAFGTPPEQPSTPNAPAQRHAGANGTPADFHPSSQGSAQASGTATPVASPSAALGTRNAGGGAPSRRPMNAPPVAINGLGTDGRSGGSVDESASPTASTGGLVGSTPGATTAPPVISPPSPRRLRVILPAPKPRPEGAALADLIWTHTSVHFVQQLIGLLNFNDIKSLRQTSRAFRTALNSYPCREIVLRRFLGQVGYRSWARPKANAPTSSPTSPQSTQTTDPIPLSFSDAEGFLLSHHLMSEYSLVAQAYIRDPQGIDGRMLTLARATTRAYNRVLARLREQPTFTIPPQRKGTADSSKSPQSPNENEIGSEALPSPWKPGRAALFQVWVPCSNGSWLSDEELTRCEAELFKAGIWKHLKRGDVVWDCAVGDEGNLGRLIYDGQFLRDLSFTYDPMGHLPSWLNSLSLSPAHFHGRIRSTTACPVVYIDMTPFREQIGATLQLVQSSSETLSPNGTRYRVQRWVYRAKVKIMPGTIISTYGLDCVHIDWAGTMTIETEGTIEHARDLITRCFGPNSAPQARLELLQAINKGPLPPLSGEDKWSYSDKSESTSPFEIVRAKSKPGQIFVRPVIKAPQMI